MRVYRYALLCIALSVMSMLPSSPSQAASQVLLTGEPGESLSMSLAPDRSYGIIIRSAGNVVLPSAIERVRLDGSQRTRLYTQPSGTGLEVLGWTADSRAIIVRKIDPPSINTVHLIRELLRINIDGSEIVSLTNPINDIACFSIFCYEPTYYGEAPDGALLYTVSRSGASQNASLHETTLFRTPRTGDVQDAVALAQITAAPNQRVWCLLTPNKQLSVCHDEQRIYVVNTLHVAPVRLVDSSATVGMIDITSDSRWLIARYYIGQTTDSLLYAIPLDQDRPAVRLSDEKVFTFIAPALTPDGSAVLFLGTSGKLYRVRLTNPPAPEMLVDFAGYNLYSMSALYINKTSQWLVYSFGAEVPGIRAGYGGVYSLALDQAAAQPQKIILLADNEDFDVGTLGLALTDDDQVVYKVSTSASSFRLMAVPLHGPASAAKALRTDAIQQGYIRSLSSSYVLLSAYNGGDYAIDLDGLHTPGLIAERDSLDDQYFQNDGLLIYRSTTISDPAHPELAIYQLILADVGLLHGGFRDATVCVSEERGAIALPVLLDNAPSNTRSMTYTISGGTATASDYTLPLSGTLTFEPGQRTSFIQIGITQDALAEPPETLLLNLSADPSSIYLTQPTITLTIRDTGACQQSLPLIVR